MVNKPLTLAHQREVIVKSKSFLPAIILSLIGTALSGTLLYQHYKLYLQGYGEKSFCSINEWINCDVVNGSSYAELFGFPLAGLGLIFYLVMIDLSIMAIVGKKLKKEFEAFAFLLALLAFLFTLYPAGISAFKLKAVCLLCSGLYVINILLPLVYAWGLGLRFGNIRSFFSDYLRALSGKKNRLDYKPQFLKISALTLVTYGVGLIVLHFTGEVFAKKTPVPVNRQVQQDADIKTLVDLHFSQNSIALEAPNRPVWGNPNAKVKIIEFSDFQCPYCRIAAETLKPALSKYKDDVALYFVNYPLDQTCNIYIGRPMHQDACNAAKAGVCANRKNKFWEMHDAIFENQKNLSSGDLISYAQKIGLDKEETMSCLFSESALQQVKFDVELGKQAAISGTPALFINGKKLNGWTNINFLNAVIEQEIENSK